MMMYLTYRFTRDVNTYLIVHNCRCSLTVSDTLCPYRTCPFLFLSLCRFFVCLCFFFCSHWSLVDVPLIFFCPADHVPDWQPCVLLGMVEARSVNVKKTTTTTVIMAGEMERIKIGPWGFPNRQHPLLELPRGLMALCGRTLGG